MRSHARLAYLLQKLKSKQEGEGTLLDNCLVLFVNEFGEETHVHTNHPYIVAGGCAGTIKTGQWLHYDGQPHNRLLLSLMRAFGMDDPTFGAAQYCAGGPLSEVLL